MSSNPYNSNDWLNPTVPPQAPPRPTQPPTPPAAPPPPASPPPPSGGSGRGARAAAAAGAAAGGFVGGMGSSFVPPVNVNVNGGGNKGGGGGGGGGTSGGGDRHQGDRMIHLVERIEIRNDKDIMALAKAINHLGRELHLILGMRAEEINGVLSTYKGRWFTFGTSSRIKARLVSAHLKVSAEAAKALGVGALKMAHAFHRHFVQPEQEAARRPKKTPAPTFTIGDN
ncbi:hypothetical protein [Streptomyces venezuelae]|uniref:hypothetical protein n=1 Tax=Streptomyces venezuelae TaxID=54571 RepID=UPI00343263B8